MKKIFAALIACVALCNVANAITPAEAYLVVHSGLEEIREDRHRDYMSTVPYETFKQYATAVVDKMVAVTNNFGNELNKLIYDVRLGSENLGVVCGFPWVCAERLNERDMDAIDTRISELFKGRKLIYTGETIRFFDEYPYFPKTCEVLFMEYDVHPLNRNVYHYQPRHGEAVSREYMAARINKNIGFFSDNFGELKLWMREFFLKAARMRLRERAEGFVVRRDGSNPLKEIFDRAAACVNAPHQAGLKEMIEEYAPGYKWVDVQYPSDMDLMVLVGDIVNGKEAIDRHRGKLFFSLGAVQYNEFVDRYNGRNQ